MVQLPSGYADHEGSAIYVVANKTTYNVLGKRQKMTTTIDSSVKLVVTNNKKAGRLVQYMLIIRMV